MHKFTYNTKYHHVYVINVILATTTRRRKRCLL